ncbi:MAG: hypothetical protein HY270_02190 [Deltaproteobacteria bacterium]|nr:hypothetical protein [Deltaproteobacteria bacterium]
MSKTSKSSAKRRGISISKPKILKRMEKLARDRSVVKAALHDLKTKPDASLLELGLVHGYVTSAKDAQHLLDDWFDPEDGWWHELPENESVLRKGLIKAGELVMRYKLPVDCYWVRGGERIELIVTKSAQQITLLFVSPPPPLKGSHAGKLSPGPDIWIFPGPRESAQNI